MGGTNNPEFSLPGGMKQPGSLPALPKIAPPTDLDHTLDLAGQVSQGLQGKLLAHVIGTLGDTAGVASALAAKSEVPIRQVLGNAAQSLIGFHAPLENSILGDLGAAIEPALRLGAVPPVAGQEPTMPATVQVREAALRGDLGPALEQYRLTAEPYQGYGGLEYAKAVQAIQAALPDDPGIQSAFVAAYKLHPLPPLLYNPGPTVVPPTYPDCMYEANRQYQIALGQCQVQTGGLAPAVNICNLAAYNAYLAAIATCGTPPVNVPPVAPSPPPAGVVPPSVIGPAPGLPAPAPGQPPRGPAPPPPAPPGPPPNTPSPGGAGGSGGPPQSPPGVNPPIGIPGGTPYCIPGVDPNCGPPADGGGNATPPPGLGGQPVPPGIQGMPGAPPGMGGQPVPEGVQGMPGAPPGMGIQPSGFPPPGQGPGAMPPTPEPPLPLPTTPAQCAAGETWIPPDDFGGGGCVVSGGGPPAPGGLTPEQIAGGCVPVPPQDQLPPPVTCPTGYYVPPSKPTKPTVSTSQPDEPGPPINSEPEKANVEFVQDDGIAGCGDFPEIPVVKIPGEFASLAEFLTIKNKDGSINVGAAKGDQWGIRDAIVGSIGSVIASLLDTLGNTFQQMTKNGACVDDKQMSMIFASTVTGLVEKLFGTSLPEMRVPNMQERNFRCPTALPSAPDAALAWLGDQISESTLECWVRAAGTRYPEYKKVIDSLRQKFPLMQLGSLYLRGKLTEEELKDRIRESGFTQDGDIADLTELLKVIPPPSDLVRFMVRDTADVALVDKFGMDDEFQAKFAGDIVDWAKASGVSDEYMQSVWRAHWSIPAPGQLFDMLHRSAELPITDPAYVDLDDVEAALKQQDILPYWVPRFINSAYNLLGRIDLRRGFQLGVIDREKLVEKYQVAGYREDDANTLADVTEATTLATFRRSPLVGQLAGGTITDEEFTEGLSADGATDDMIAAARKRALTIARGKKRKRCTDAYHKRYLAGDLSTAGGRANLLALGLSADIVDTLIDGWQCERDARGKAIPAGELAALYSQGAITADSLTSRLKIIGYSYEDAVLLTRRIAYSTQQKISKAESDAIRQQEKQDQAAQRQDAAAAKQAIAQAQRNAKRVVSLNRVNTLRTKRLLESGRNFGAHSGTDLSTAAAVVQSVYQRSLSDGGWLPDEIIAAIVTATQDKTITDAATLAASVRNLLVTSIPNFSASDESVAAS